MKEIANYLRLAMIQAWLRGASRDETAEQFGVGNGTVSNILDKLRKSLGNYEFDSIREFVRYLRQEGMTAADCVFGSRIH
ncbi:MAG TPA: helix-turn-helix domain-containing protein [Nitrososphaeraceae archaeon]|nr:helix-turn-helix domain-containing protein [Nitrososphaeraceae archaeon]